VLGLIQVESGFRKYAISSAGARGYMQVMPFWARVIGDGDASRLFHMQTNLRFGCVILRHYLDRERGDLFMALGRYNGSRGKSPNTRTPCLARRAALVALRRQAPRPCQPGRGAVPAGQGQHPLHRVVHQLVDAGGLGRTPAAAGRRCRPSR
jgi:hypothetical protein